MEVEARMKRNYLPPSIQGGYNYQNQTGYQSPPSTNTATNPQGSITAGTPNFAKNSMKPVLETIPQGSIMGSNQATTPFTPCSSQFSPSHGTVPQTGSIISGTPMSNQGSIMAGTPISTPLTNPNFPNNVPHQGSIISGTPVQSQFNTISNQSSIITGTISSQGMLTGSLHNKGSIVSGTPMQNQRLIMAGTPIQSQGSIMSGTPIHNQGSIISGTPVQGQGSIISGTPIQNQGSISITPVQGHGLIMTGTPLQNQRSIMTGTPLQNQGSTMTGTSIQSQNYAPSQNQTFSSQGSIIAGTAIESNNFVTFGYSQSYSPTFPNQSMPSGSITAGTPVSSGFNSNQYSRQRKYSGPQRVKLQMLATVQEMVREHAERYSPVRRAEVSPPRAAHDIASARLEYQQLQRGLERRSGTSAIGVGGVGAVGRASPPADRLHTPAASVPGSPIHAGASTPTLDLSAVDPARERAAQDLSLKLGINLNNLYSPHLSQDLLKSIHYGSYGILSSHSSPSPGSPLHQITEGLSYLHTGSITRGTPQPHSTPLDLRNNVEMETNYPQLQILPQIHLTHRSLNNSPISSPSLDMIQEEIGNGSQNEKFLKSYQPPQISLTDCLGSEITLVASSSEDSVDSLENSKYHIPQFVISEHTDLDNKPSIIKGIGRKVSQETAKEKVIEDDTDMEKVDTKLDTRRNSDKSLGFSDDSLSNDSANASPNCEHNVQSIYSNIVSISSGFSENRGSFSEHRESFSFSDRGSFSERGDFGRSSFSEKGETPRSSFSAQGVLGEVKEYYEEYMPRDKNLENFIEECPQEEIEKLQRSTMDLRLTEICKDNQKIPILLSPQNISCVQEYYEIALSTVCSQLDSERIVELLKETINTRVPPQNIFVETSEQKKKSDDAENLTGFLNLEYSGGIQIELVLCENKAKEKKGLKMRRISGDHNEYGKLCQQLITSLTV